MYNTSGLPISRTYLGEVVVDGSGEIIPDTIQSYTVARKQVTDLVVHKDAVFHGGVDFGQKWVNVTAERYANVTYTNNTGKPIQMFVRYNTATAGTPILTLGSGELLYGSYIPLGEAQVSNFNIPVNQTYKFSMNGITILHWKELR